MISRRPMSGVEARGVMQLNTSKTSNPFRRLLDAAQRRFRRARPGSVLIMVVALLVLLALIGTAAMSTARLDPMSSAPNVKNVQVDMYAESLKNIVVGEVVADLFNTGNGGYRDVMGTNTSYDHFD